MTVECEICGREFDSKQGLGVHNTTTHEADDKPYTDKDKLNRLYWGRGLSMRAVAEELDTDVDRVAYWMGVHGIETREAYTDQEYASYTTDKDGYELWKTYHNGDYLRIRVHRLLAVSEYGFEAVCGNDVHHEEPIPWLNTPDNIMPVDPREHRRIHGEERAEEQRELMNDLWESGKLKQ